MTKFSMISVGGTKEQILTLFLVFMICRHNLPYSFVEWIALRAMLKFLVPNYVVPSRTTITRKVDETANVVRHNLKQTLAMIDNLSLTVDLWTEEHTKRSFLGNTWGIFLACI